MTELRASSADGYPVTALVDGPADEPADGPLDESTDGSEPTTLLVVHPGGGDTTAWDAVTRHLAADFRVVRIRRRIYVVGAEIALPHSMAVEAADILAIAGCLNSPAVLVGHSSGAVAALEAAVRDPSLFSGLFLYEPPMPTRELVAGAAGVRARAAFDAGDPIEAMRIHLRDIVRMPAALVDAIFANETAQGPFATFAAAQLADTEAIDALGVGIDRFAALDVPTTLVEGDLSPAHLRQRVADLAATLPNARVVTLPGQSHIAHLTAPELLAAAIRDAVRAGR